ncbi:hypothetical protein B0H11DRAFT_2264308 [Mycena galericulata]|nr:hypothetical protein B0H11DRAFT_2264308 [Mycena galericulata]
MEGEVAAISAPAMSETVLQMGDLCESARYGGYVFVRHSFRRGTADLNFQLTPGETRVPASQRDTNIPIATLSTHSTIKGITALIDASNNNNDNAVSMRSLPSGRAQPKPQRLDARPQQRLPPKPVACKPQHPVWHPKPQRTEEPGSERCSAPRAIEKR